MTMLRKKRDDKKMVGAYLPHHLSYYLTLYGLFIDQSKSKIIESIVNKWYKETSQMTSENQIIVDIRKRVWNQWRIEKTQGVSIEDFKARYTLYMQKKNINGRHIEQIINIITE